MSEVSVPDLMDTIAVQDAEVTTLKSEVAALRGQVHALQEEVHRLKAVLHGPAPQRYRIDKKLEGHTGKILSLHWLADELLVSSADDDTVRIWDITTGQCLHTIDNVAPCLGVISTGYHVLTIDADSLPLDVQLWDALSGRCLRTSSLSGPAHAIDEFDTKATDMLDHLESGGADSVADECTSIACHLIVPRRAFAPGDDPTPFRPPAVVMTADKPQRVVQRKGKHASFCEHHLRPAAVSRGTSGKLALSRSATSRNLLSTLVEAAPVVASGYDAQDQAAEEYGYLMDSDCGVGDAALGIVAKTKPPVTAEATDAGAGTDAEAEAEAEAAGVTIDDWLIVGGEDCLLRVMDIATGKIVRVLEGHYQTITSLALVASDIDATKRRRFSHLVVLSASVDMTIRAWDVLRGTTLATLSGHHSSIRCLSILPPESLPEDSRSGSPLDTKTAKGPFGGTTKWDDDGNKIEAYVVSGSEGGSLRLWALRRTVRPRTSSSFTAYRVSNNFYDPSNYTDDDSDDDDDSSRDSSNDGGYHHYDNPFAEPPLPRHLTKEERRRYGKCECLASIDNGHVESITCLHTIAVHSSSTTVAAAVAASVAPASLQALSRSQASLTSLLNAPTSSGSSQTGGAQTAPTTHHHSVSVISGSEDTTLRVWSVRTMLAEYDYEYCLLLQGHRAKINFTLPVTLPPPQSLFGSLTASSKTVMGGESPRPLLSSDAGLPSTFPVETSGSAKTASRLLTATSSSFYFHQQQQPPQPPSQCQYLHPHPSAAAALAPSGLLAGQQVILSGSDDGTMVLWDVHSGDALHTLHGHIDSVQCALVLDQIEYSPATTALLNDHSEASTTDIDAPATPAASAAVDLEPHRHHVLVSGGSRGVLYTWAWS